MRDMKPAVNRRADHGRKPVTFQDLYLLWSLVNLMVHRFYAPNKGAAIAFAILFAISGGLHGYQC
jgi:hypothetical protein